MAITAPCKALKAARPKAPRAMERAAIGRQVDESLERIAELEDELARTPARTIADVGVLLRWIDAANKRGEGRAIPVVNSPSPIVAIVVFPSCRQDWRL